MEEGFELVVKSGDFRGGDAGCERQNELVPLDFRCRKSGVSRSLQVEGPEAVVGVGAGRECQQRSREAQKISDEPSKESSG